MHLHNCTNNNMTRPAACTPLPHQPHLHPCLTVSWHMAAAQRGTS